MWAKADENKKVKIVANEKCTKEIGEMSLVKNLFWVNHATINAQTSLKRKILKMANVPEKNNCLCLVILEN